VLLISPAPAEKEIDMKSKYRSRIDRQHINILAGRRKSWSDSKIIVMEKRKEKPKRPGNKRLKEKLDRDQLYMGESFNSREREGGPLEIDTHTHKTTTSSQWSRVHNGRRMRHAPKAATAANPRMALLYNAVSKVACIY
jgi:hypothetical protein